MSRLFWSLALFGCAVMVWRIGTAQHDLGVTVFVASISMLAGLVAFRLDERADARAHERWVAGARLREELARRELSET